MSADIIVVQTTSNQISVSGSGPQGPSGSGNVHEYDQNTPAATWVISHNLGRAVSAEVYVNGEQVLTDVINTDINTLTIIFASVQTGYVLYS